jgi:hypothetical protein
VSTHNTTNTLSDQKCPDTYLKLNPTFPLTHFQSWTLILGGPTLCLYDSSNSAGETFYQVSVAVHSSWSNTVDSTQWVRVALYSSAFTFPCSITRGPSPFHEKCPHIVMPPPPKYTIGITHAGSYHSLGICHIQILPSDCHVI